MADGDMKIVDMSRTPAEKKAAQERYAIPSDAGPDYPYGLCLSLGKDELAKLGIEELPEVGDEFHLYAVACVTRVSQTASKDTGEDSKGVELQITQLGALLDDDDDDLTSKAARTLYGKAEKAEGE